MSDIHVLTDAYVEVAGADISDHVASVTLTNMREVLEATVMGDEGKRRVSGLGDCSVEVELRQDYVDGGSPAQSIESILWDNLGAEVAVKIRKSKTDAISSTNPSYEFNGIYGSVPLVQGGVGEVHNTSITIENSDGAVMVRDVTP